MSSKLHKPEDMLMRVIYVAEILLKGEGETTPAPSMVVLQTIPEDTETGLDTIEKHSHAIVL
jgi:hypothetical protein